MRDSRIFVVSILVVLTILIMPWVANYFALQEIESQRATFFTTQYSQRDPSGKLWFLIELDKSHQQFIISDDCIVPLKPSE